MAIHQPDGARPVSSPPKTRRRKSSSLGGDPRGDTGAPALATSDYDLARHVQKPSPRMHYKRRKAKTFVRQTLRVVTRHTWLLPLAITLTVLSLYMLQPTESNPLHACIFLSYPVPHGPDASPHSPRQYGKGRADLAFVAFYTVVLSFAREFIMQRAFRPFAIWLGIQRRAKQHRFMEQAYTALYFAILGPFGLYVMNRSPVWYFDTTAMFEGFPHITHDALFKAYYLIQAAYWTQQAVVLLLMLERPRKDFKELVLHHVVTLALIWLSYRFHFTYMGIAVYITHDISDFFLATSKTLNYVDSPITAPFFVLFVGMWIYLRHYLNLHILWATLTKFRTVGPFELDWAAQQYKFWFSQYVAFSLLAVLQMVNLFWLFLIFRIMARVLTAKAPLADDRSDDETEEGEEESRAPAKPVADIVSAVEAPQVLLNGSPVDEQDPTQGTAGLMKRRKV